MPCRPSSAAPPSVVQVALASGPLGGGAGGPGGQWPPRMNWEIAPRCRNLIIYMYCSQGS
ncbi:hypothetical protein PF002_g3221 [Phytophthora fragariae]|uniref:Uncharacterized protein n=1 Tax=Phytophthora fragariae TaxID=53985 RepID=A0A6A3FJ51_9STRA|nr:hypothetical protein PF003_g7202 [Phytophthora fragariae]KAE8945809.1 hypothetical protein PF009_g4562 [Phytophthora fragariae]KAE9026535.1 hypothetical protein PF011_g2502 [Phytophthora fragariae]KAE9131258.1 hypothetical protein PF007_g4210 [Phytophthora fragariae]KAE9150453.1 hypothetical protein PF006_g5168 [Phytophthora fragariae]